MRVLLDLDCTLADFIGGLADWFSVSPSLLTTCWTPGEYGMTEPISKAIGKQMTDSDVWGALNGSAEF